MENFPHLPFEPSLIGSAKLRGGGKVSPQTLANKRNRPSHKQSLGDSLDLIRSHYENETQVRASMGLPDLPAGVPILLQVDPKGFDVEKLKSSDWGLEVVCEMEDGYVIVVSPDADLGTFYQQLDRFVAEERGSATVANVYEVLFEEDQRSRLERILHPSLLERWAEVVVLPAISVEISIECLGVEKLPEIPKQSEYKTESGFIKAQRNFEGKKQDYFIANDQLRIDREESIASMIDFYRGRIESIYEAGANEEVGFADSFTIVATISGEGLRDIALTYPFVFEIAALEPCQFENAETQSVASDLLPEILAPEISAPSIVIIDSGIQEGHPLLSLSIRSTLSRNFLDPTDTAQDDHPNYGGHGTRVAGAALFPIGVSVGPYQLPFYLVNAKVLDSTGHIPECVLPARLLEKIVMHYWNLDRSIKIYNHSISSATSAKQRYMSSWAAKIDDLSYTYDVLFVQAAGNVSIDNSHPTMLGIKQHLIAGRDYPDFLREDSCKVANPSQSFNALTVGSISSKDLQTADYHSIGNVEGPSPFSRTGPSIWNVVKPDVVEIGGDLSRSRDANPLTIGKRKETSLELPRRTDGGIPVDSSEVGTSFSAPVVAHLAAILQTILPAESSLLYRGLIAQSAQWPQWRLSPDEYFNNFSHFGFGLPNLERATRNSENRITFYSRGRKPILSKEIHFFEIPIPEEIRTIGSEYDILIEVTLSYCAKPRRTRKNVRKYLSTWVEWVSSKKDESMETFVNRVSIVEEETEIRSAKEIPWMLQNQDNWGQVGGIKRNVGTLQKDWATVKSHQLEESFSIAVRGRQGWDTTDTYPAYYSLIVSMEATNAEIQLYNRIRTEVEVRSQIQIPIRA